MDPAGSNDVEAPKDPGALKSHDVTDNEILGKKRNATPMVGVFPLSGPLLIL